MITRTIVQLQTLFWGVMFAQSTVSEQRGAAWVMNRSVLSTDDFSPERLNLISQHLLIDAVNQVIARYEFFESQEVASERGVSIEKPVLYEDWRASRKRELKNLGRYAELLKIGPGAVIRSRDSKGATKEVVLRPPNPLNMRQVGVDGDIVYLQMWSQNREVTPKSSVVFAVCLRIYSGEPAEGGRRAMKHLNEIVPGVDLRLSVRQDPWFVSEMRLSPWFPFLGGGEAPELNVWKLRETTRCDRDGCYRVLGQ